MKKHVNGKILSSDEMKEVREQTSSGSGSGTDAPCEILLVCSNGKTIRCASNLPGTTCSYAQAGFGDVTPYIGVCCGNNIINCNDGGSGSGSGSGSDTNPTATDVESGLL